MPANVESYVGREPAWHGLGTVFDRALTLEEALTTGNLGGWNVRTVPAQGQVIGDTGVTTVTLDDRFLTVRDNPADHLPQALGVVGRRYRSIQNEEAFEFIHNVVDGTGAIVETAGSLDNGRQTFLSVRMPEGIQIAGQDAHDLYALVATSHDESLALTAAATAIRVVCQNTLNLALGSAPRVMRIKHTNSARGRVAEARETLQLTFAYGEQLAATSELLLKQTMTRADFVAYALKLFPAPKDLDGRAATVHAQRLDELTRLFNFADTNEFGRGTAYAALQSVVEYADWYYPVQQGSTGRAVRTMLETVGGQAATTKVKDKALALLT